MSLETNSRPAKHRICELGLQKKKKESKKDPKVQRPEEAVSRIKKSAKRTDEYTPGVSSRRMNQKPLPSKCY
jgi:hypothetical protein